jgi:hypothetical protein
LKGETVNPGTPLGPRLKININAHGNILPLTTPKSEATPQIGT